MCCIANALRFGSEDLDYPQVGPITERIIRHKFDRATELLLVVFGNAPLGSSAVVALQLDSLMQHANVKICALTCMFAGLVVIHPTLAAILLILCLQEDEDIVEKLAAVHIQRKHNDRIYHLGCVQGCHSLRHCLRAISLEGAAWTLAVPVSGKMRKRVTSRER